MNEGHGSVFLQFGVYHLFCSHVKKNGDLQFWRLTENVTTLRFLSSSKKLFLVAEKLSEEGKGKIISEKQEDHFVGRLVRCDVIDD